MGTTVLLAALFLVTAALDWPAKEAWRATEVDAPRRVVWEVLTDFAAYPSWNPVVTEVHGELRQGARVEATVVLATGERRNIQGKWSIVRPPRRLGVQYRFILPGLRDREYEITIESLGPDRVRLIQHERVEGPLAPFTGTEEVERTLEALAEAIRRRAETVARPS